LLGRILHWLQVPILLSELQQRLLSLVSMRAPASFTSWCVYIFGEFQFFSFLTRSLQKGRAPAKALEVYKKGNAFRAAVDLCRASFPAQVTATEEAWGDYLCAQQQTDAAINHYIEAGATGKAVEAAIVARQWAKAASVVEILDAKSAAPYASAIAEYYATVGDFAQAERFFLMAHDPKSAVDMFIKVRCVFQVTMCSFVTFWQCACRCRRDSGSRHISCRCVSWSPRQWLISLLRKQNFLNRSKSSKTLNVCTLPSTNPTKWAWDYYFFLIQFINRRHLGLFCRPLPCTRHLGSTTR
jgi:hypothetical protein